MRHRHGARALVPVAAGISLSIVLSAVAPVAVLGQATASPEPAASVTPAPESLTIAATYPSIVADPGGEARFGLEVTGPGRERVDLAVSGVPEGFEASFRGGSATVNSVSTGGEEPAELELRVSVPDDAAPGTASLVVTATAPGGSVELPLDVVVADTSGGSVSLSTEFPVLRGDSEDTYSFDLELENDTAQDIDFVLTTEAPADWEVEARPAGEAQAATTQVAAGATENVTVTVTPARRAEPGQYLILVRASGDGYDAETQLGVEITGSYALRLDSLDGRLSTSASAGSTARFDVLVLNEGTAPLVDVTLSAGTPAGWEVTFEPETIETVATGETATAIANITPAGNAVAGDYIVTISAESTDADDSIEVRTTVETSTTWGILAVVIIGAVLLGLAFVFRRFGRR